MTDNDIKKGLECHASQNCEVCEKCPYAKVDYCAEVLSEHALDLINRQQARIEKLEEVGDTE